jgi:AraC family ethanolamine operon transcriptional activator
MSDAKSSLTSIEPVRTVEFREHDAFRYLFRRGDIEIVHKGGGAFSGKLMTASIVGCGLEFGWWGQPVLARGTVRPGGPGFIFALDPKLPCRFLGQEVDESMFGAYRPGAEHCAASGSAYPWCFMSFETVEFEAALARSGGRLPASSPSGAEILRTSPALLANATRVFCALRESMVADGARLGHPEVQRSITGTLLAAVVGLISSDDGRDRLGAVRAQGRLRIVRRAEEYLHSRNHEPVYIPELSAAIGVSQRLLEYAFRDCYGLSPARYLRLRRLHEARRRLQAEGQRVPRVIDVAADLGFWDAGRFAGDYRRLFGESPSATLRANAMAGASLREGE